MQRALELAALGAATTQPNPRVGCVIARGDTIIGEGWHQRSGEPHAEVLALRAAGEAARGATAFVTLEPCNHHGRTPPCSEALIAAGIAKVIFACGDPDPRVDGSGAARLCAAGIEVETGLLSEQGEELNLGFFKRMRTGRPWVRLKLAASLDGRTALASGESRWITSPQAREDVHRFRAESAAILSTSATVIADDPELTARPVDPVNDDGKIRHPWRVILDRHLRIPSVARVFATQGEIVRLTSASALASATIPNINTDTNRRIEAIASAPDGRLSLEAVLAWMGGAGLNEVWTEAGPTLAGALLTVHLVDELVLYLAPRVLGSDARPLAHLAGPMRLAESPEWRICDLRQTGTDSRIMLRPNR
ncbi:MAG: bifunctional diaminohydroxyphosphoribosylaminopyrimidine deaminase/5-amino-6-(5-phosphoribosylamino)uracil reductase RibD [Gammaproteobacteria bacterium]|nr:bifunctional diaminohydroxyphosphoribosylaminopyrimidine deaminase/5-amino-6-(5-phosphoribosylamino)uracil reductase RibD [Gammaproteobacteria bacterium]